MEVLLWSVLGELVPTLMRMMLQELSSQPWRYRKKSLILPKLLEVLTFHLRSTLEYALEVFLWEL